VSAVDDHHPVGQQQCVEHVVGHDHGRASMENPAQHLAYGGCDGHVERCHRLVEEQQPWVGSECPGDCYPLCLPPGELGGLPVGVLLGVDLGQPALRQGA
jgi:hypothetical protein